MHACWCEGVCACVQVRMCFQVYRNVNSKCTYICTPHFKHYSQEIFCSLAYQYEILPAQNLEKTYEINNVI